MLSRTAAGVSDTSSSPHKPGLAAADGAELALQAAVNLEKAAALAWKMRYKIPSPDEVRIFLDELARTVSDELIKGGHPLYRTWGVRYTGPVEPSGIEAAYEGLCVWLAHALVKESDLLAVAAELEKGLNLRIHPFADGCGRVSRVAGAWVLLRQNLPPAIFSGRDAYYQAMRSPERDWHAAYRAASSEGMRLAS
ncbi:MAG TPA: Fic family protein [Candidatus Paceibacterota bacterium]|nr:Fic family protein [Candidatus Paceibacterota bacterium]